jgi:hypothetical protein
LAFVDPEGHLLSSGTGDEGCRQGAFGQRLWLKNFITPSSSRAGRRSSPGCQYRAVSRIALTSVPTCGRIVSSSAGL